MTARKSQRVLDLEAELQALGAYREAFFCLRSGETPVVLISGGVDPGEDNSGCRVELLGASRASGGVVIVDGGGALYAFDWLVQARGHVNPYVREVARLVERTVTAAIQKRTGGGS